MSDRLDELTAAILAGGLGSRLRSVVPDSQKVVAPVAGRPFIFRLLDQLAAAGLRRAVICAGYKADQVATLVGTQYRTLQLQYSTEPDTLGTAGAIRHALPLLDSDPVLVLNGDSFCDVDLAAFWQTHRARQAAASLVVTELADTSASGRVCFDAANQITSFIEKSASTGPGWINAGIYLLQRTVIESIPPGRAVSIERETFPSWAGRGLFAFSTTGKFLDIGTPVMYFKAQTALP